MLTEAERKELEELRADWAIRREIVRLVELEKREALGIAAAHLEAQATKIEVLGNTTAGTMGRIYRNEATVIAGLLDRKEAATDFDDAPTTERKTGGESEPEWRRVLERLRIEAALCSDRVKTDGLACLCEADLAQRNALEELEALRRVVLAGQGEAAVPETVAKYLGLPTLDGWTVAAFFRECVGLKKEGMRGQERIKSYVLMAIDAAATEAL